MTPTGEQPARLLVVEDEPTIAESVAARLRAEGFEVRIAADGHQALSAAAEWQPDAVVLDLMLPGVDGLEVCRRLQADRPVPVLMLTARDDETDLLVGLGVGADDYLTKPFSMRELVARVRSLLRRVVRAAELHAQQPATPELRLGDVVVSPAQRRVRRAGVEVHLTPTEFDLLVHLASRPRTVHTREQLVADLWGWSEAGGSRTVDSHVKALRRKLGADLIRTVHGVGYALERRPGESIAASAASEERSDRGAAPSSTEAP
ncbi:MAG: response regulator transcription factor [Micromonosporaceae bacterium]